MSCMVCYAAIASAARVALPRPSQFHHDFATLRRELVDAQVMARKDSIYWRV